MRRRAGSATELRAEQPPFLEPARTFIAACAILWRMDGEVVKVVIADDHAVVRSGLRILLENEDGLHVVAEAGDVPTAMRMIRAHRPQVAVLDLNMPGGSALELSLIHI